MATVYTRAAKGSALTWTEGDANITNLNTDKIEAVVDDTAPQLGGNLDVNDNLINTSVVNGNISLVPDGTGRIVVGNSSNPTKITTTAEQNLVLETNFGTNSGSITITAGSNGDITITPDASGSIVLDGQEWPQAAPATNDQYLQGNANGTLAWTDRVNAKTIYETVKNATLGELVKGTPVYQVGVDGNTITVGAARADDPSKLAIGVLDETIASEAEGRMLVLGEIKGVNTLGFTSGDKVYLGETGGYTNTAPTGSAVARQFLGIVIRVDETNGSGFITGTLTEDQIKYTGTAFELWDGDSWVTVVSIARGSISVTDSGGDGSLSYDNSTGVITYTGPSASDVRAHFSGGTGITITDGVIATTITQYTDSLARAAISVTDTGGDGSLSYDSGTGVITYDGPSASEVRAHFTGGTAISITDGVIAYTGAQPTGNELENVVEDTTPQLGGDLDVNGQSIVSVSNGNIVVTPNGTGKSVISKLNYDEGAIYDLGTTSGTITPNVTNGNVQKITLNGNLTFSAFTTPAAGQSITLIIDTNGTSRTLTSTMLFAGGDKTISVTDTVDIITAYYDGTNYYASLAKDFK